MKRYLLTAFVGMIFLGGCQSVAPKPMAHPQTQEDLVRYQPSPHPEELIAYSKPILLFLQSNLEQTDFAPQLQEGFYRILEERAGFQRIPAKRYAYRRNLPELAGLNPLQLSHQLKLAEAMEADYLARMEIGPNESEDQSNYQGSLKVEIIETKTGEALFVESLTLKNPGHESALRAFAPKIEKAFPLKGYLLQTRANKRFAKISLGRSRGIALGREFTLHKRTLEPIGQERQKERIHPIEVSRGRVVLLKEYESWLELEEETRAKALEGMPVLSRPR